MIFMPMKWEDMTDKEKIWHLMERVMSLEKMVFKLVEEARKVTPGKQILDGLYNALRKFDKYDEKGKVNL